MKRQRIAKQKEFDNYDYRENLHIQKEEITKSNIPDKCKVCEDMHFEKEDNRFDCPARFKGDKTRYGQFDFIPTCSISGEAIEDKIFCEVK